VAGAGGNTHTRNRNRQKTEAVRNLVIVYYHLRLMKNVSREDEDLFIFREGVRTRKK
jgi:hypothetical protein